MIGRGRSAWEEEEEEDPRMRKKWKEIGVRGSASQPLFWSRKMVGTHMRPCPTSLPCPAQRKHQ